jgi:hypothetical protein
VISCKRLKTKQRVCHQRWVRALKCQKIRPRYMFRTLKKNSWGIFLRYTSWLRDWLTYSESLWCVRVVLYEFWGLRYRIYYYMNDLRWFSNFYFSPKITMFDYFRDIEHSGIVHFVLEVKEKVVCIQNNRKTWGIWDPGALSRETLRKWITDSPLVQWIKVRNTL